MENYVKKLLRFYVTKFAVSCILNTIVHLQNSLIRKYVLSNGLSLQKSRNMNWCDKMSRYSTKNSHIFLTFNKCGAEKIIVYQGYWINV